jgi:hypothetical protein
MGEEARPLSQPDLNAGVRPSCGQPLERRRRRCAWRHSARPLTGRATSGGTKRVPDRDLSSRRSVDTGLRSLPELSDESRCRPVKGMWIAHDHRAKSRRATTHKKPGLLRQRKIVIARLP